MDELEGLNEIQKRMRKLSGRQGKNALRRALTKGARKIVLKARQNVRRIDDPATAEQISKNIVSRSGGTRRERFEKGVVKSVGVQGGARPMKEERKDLPGGNTTHWRFVEFGTSSVPARPFMRSAMEEAATAAFNATAEAAIVELDKEIAKL